MFRKEFICCLKSVFRKNYNLGFVRKINSYFRSNFFMMQENYYKKKLFLLKQQVCCDKHIQTYF